MKIDDAVKQARAEVLAACIADVEKALAIYMEHKGRSKDDKALIGGVCLGIKSRLEELQPAAVHLKELLRKERDGTEARLLCANGECPKRHLRIEWSEEDKFCLGCLRDALNYQLGFKEGEEKARALAKQT